LAPEPDDDDGDDEPPHAPTPVASRAATARTAAGCR
jgi:hypothetical protein